MKKVLTVALILMVILTVIYVSAVVYANTNANACPHRYVLYGAVEYESETPPTDWYTMEQLGIYGVTEYGENGSSLHVAVDREKEPFPLQSENPIFLYKDKFYEVSPLWTTPGLSEDKQWQIPIGAALGACWTFTGVLFLKWSKKE